MSSSPKPVKSVYLKGYAKMDELKEDIRFPTILDLLPTLELPKNSVLLDIGCGDGLFTLQMAKKIKAKKLNGIDIAPAAAEQANKNGVETIAMDIDEKNLPYKDSTFDFIFCGNLIELVLNADHLLQEMERVLKPHGKIIMSFPNIASWGSRISLLFGYLPFFSRISTGYDLGKIYGGVSKGQSTGFIRLFTLSAFTQLAKLYNLKVLKAQGTPELHLPSFLKQIDSVLSKKTTLAFHLIVVLSKT